MWDGDVYAPHIDLWCCTAEAAAEEAPAAEEAAPAAEEAAPEEAPGVLPFLPQTKGKAQGRGMEWQKDGLL